MKEQTFLIEKLDSGFLVTTASKQHGVTNVYDAVKPMLNLFSEGFKELAQKDSATSIEITISHKVHYKPAEPNDDNAGNHGV